jgi:hypothetical protein
VPSFGVDRAARHLSPSLDPHDGHTYMRRLFPILVVVALALGYSKFFQKSAVSKDLATESATDRLPSPEVVGATDTSSRATPQRSFQCDGRSNCSQMTSCEEATYFLQHCPGVKMDGDGDGVPCERQWCGTH